MTNLELAQGLHHGLFGDRGTDIHNAMRDAHNLIDAIEGADQIAAFTALYVVLNTVSNIIKQNEMEQIK